MKNLIVNNHRGSTFVIFDENPSNHYDLVVADSRFKNNLFDYFKGDLLPEDVSNLLFIDVNHDTKKFEGPTFKRILNTFCDKNPKKVLVVGGGTVQDVASFVCSIYHRGVEWHFVPTTFAAMVDSCIGSKTSMDYKNVKNKIGTFFPASMVYINTNFLKTITTEQWNDGFGELQHILLLGKPDQFDYNEININSFEQVKDNLEKYIYLSLKTKEMWFRYDEFDQGIRKHLNLGHTFGHALEKQPDLDITHGTAVSWGLEFAINLSVVNSMLEIEVAEELLSFVRLNDIPSVVLDVDSFMESLSKDKKASEKVVDCILLEGNKDRYNSKKVSMTYGFIEEFVRKNYA